MIELDGVSKTYGPYIVFEEVSLSFRENSFNVLAGRSGSGKTTLLNIIGGLDAPTHGYVFINGESISQRKIAAYRNEQIGFVFQKINLIKNLSLKDNLKIAFDLAKKKMSEEALRDCLEKVGLLDSKETMEHFLKKMPNELSIGQMQRFSIARALIKNPKILLLDEPTSALDEENEKKIISLLANLSKERTVIVSTRNKELFVGFADQIVEMEDKTAYVVKPYEKEKLSCLENETKFRKGHLSISTSFKIGFINLKNRKVRLFISFLLSSFTAMMFGGTFLFQTHNTNKVLLENQIANHERGAFLQYMERYRGHSSDYIQEDVFPFSKKQLSDIEEYTNGVFSPVYYLPSYNGEFGFETFADFPYTSAFYNLARFSRSFDGCDYIELDKNKSAEFGLTRYSALQLDTECRLPDNYNEIAISALFAEILKTHGLVVERDNSSSRQPTKIFHAKKVDDLIGMSLDISGLKICGIFSTEDDRYSFWRPYFDNIHDYESEQIKKKGEYLTGGYSLSRFCFMKKGYRKHYLKRVKKEEGAFSPSLVYVKLKGDFTKDYAFIESFKRGKSLFIELKNLYSSSALIIKTFSEWRVIVSWAIVGALILISAIASLSLYHANVKSFKHDIGILKAMGASNGAIIGITLSQVFLVSLLELLLGIIGLNVFIFMINESVVLNLFTLDWPCFISLFILVVVTSLFIAALSLRKTLRQKPIDIIEEKFGVL